MKSCGRGKNYLLPVNFRDRSCEIGIRQANIRRMIDGNFGNISVGDFISKVAYQGNGGNGIILTCPNGESPNVTRSRNTMSAKLKAALK